jgi:P-type Ca2+ transporter type 2C
VNAHEQTVDEVLSALAVTRAGLTSEEARKRLDEHGPNELAAEKPVPAWRKFLAQFEDALVILLLVATAISFGLWFYERDSALPYEALAIFAVILLNAIMGYIQESRAETAVAALRKMAAAQAHLMRGGQRTSVPSSEVVPGDILVISEGDTVPADARLIEVTGLQTAEAALTGESLPVMKEVAPIKEASALGDRRNMLFSGTAATYGHGQAVVIGTGMNTEMGRIAGMLKAAPPEITPLQRELQRTGKMLGLIVVAIAIVMIVTIIVVKDVTGITAILDVLIIGVALAVAAVPEGLPAVVTAVLSMGVQRMARRKAIVRHLAAVETLGSATVIASDKTGTLTKNEMTVRRVVTASGRLDFNGTGYAPVGEVKVEGGRPLDGPIKFELIRALAAADRANNSVLQEKEGRWMVRGDPTEGALIVAARKAGLDDAELDARLERVGEVPFSSERKLMTTVHTDAQRLERLVVFTKGAPDVLLANCSHELSGEQSRPLTQERRSEILTIVESLAEEALRTLGVAMRSLPKETPRKDLNEGIEHEMVFLGLIGMIDPARDEAKEAVSRTKAAGIRPMMITGDHPKTGAVIGQALGLIEGGRAMTGVEIEKLDDKALVEAVRKTSVYARVNPQHKLRIVQALQTSGEVVAMTGDGVNDAPALKTADIGVAMGITGTDVSKQAADIILADDNFATIVAAIEEGRTIFSNIRKFLRYLLSSNIGEVLTMFLGVLLADRIGLRAEEETIALPLLATQLLWINLVTDGAPALALGLDPPNEGTMAKPPRPTKEPVITGGMWFGILFTGAIFAVGTLLMLDASLPGGLIEGTGNMRYGQTMAFTTLVFFSLFAVFNARSDERSAFSGLFSNLWLWGAVALSLGLQVLVVYTPVLQKAFSTTNLSMADWIKCLAVGSSVLWLREVCKIVVRRRQKKS